MTKETIEVKEILKATMKSAKVARLLAEENIHVEYSTEAKTASFNPTTRVLEFPYSMILEDEDIHMLFMFHEISHAKHLSTNFVKNVQEFFDCANIVVDIRDERLIKKQYPGSVKHFTEGYKKLLNKEFFGPVNAIAYHPFHSRLNVYAKVGPITGAFINFSEKEQEFMGRAFNANTEEEIIELAKELKSLSVGRAAKNDIADLLSKVSAGEIDDLFNALIGSVENDEDDSHISTAEKIKELIKQLLEVNSQETFDESLGKNSLSGCDIIAYTTADKKIISTIKYQEYLKYLDNHGECNIADNIREFRKDIGRSVDYMVKEFESRKAAWRAKRARISTNGLLDVNRVVNYKFTDEIFGKNVKIADAKNHGFVILLDCSGSISREYPKLVEQVITLTEFFRRIHVPYKVYAFGAHISNALCSKKYISTGDGHPEEFVPNPYDLDLKYTKLSISTGTVIEVLSSEMNVKEHNIALSGMYYRKGFYLGDTPTINTILQMEYLANEFFTKHRVDKKKLICITDGGATDATGVLRSVWYSRTLRTTVVMTDPVNKKNYSFPKYEYAGPDAIGSILRDRYGIDFVTLSVSASFKEEVVNTFTGTASVLNANAKEFRRDGYTKLKSPTGNDVFIIKVYDIDNDMEGFDVSQDDSVAAIKRKFVSKLSKMNKSRNFLNAITQYLAQ